MVHNPPPLNTLGLFLSYCSGKHLSISEFTKEINHLQATAETVLGPLGHGGCRQSGIQGIVLKSIHNIEKVMFRIYGYQHFSCKSDLHHDP